MKHTWTVFCWAVLALGLAISCTRKPTPSTPTPPAEEHDFGEASATEYVRALEAADFAGSMSQALTATGMEVSPRFPVIYFDFDSEALRIEFLEPLEAAVRDSRARWVCYVDGHASPEGSEAYNLALGERRALTVANYLELLGGISTVSTSYGEERPAPGDAWRSRRVEVKCR